MRTIFTIKKWSGPVWGRSEKYCLSRLDRESIRLVPGRRVLQSTGGLVDLLGRIREGNELIVPLKLVLVILVITHSAGGIRIGTVGVVTDLRMAVEFLQGQGLDLGSTTHSPALAVGSMVVGHFEGQLAAALVIEGLPGGAVDRSQVGTLTDTVDILGSSGNVVGYEISLGTEQQAVSEADDGPVDEGARPVGVVQPAPWGSAGAKGCMNL